MVERQGWSLVRSGFKVSYVVCDDQPEEVYDDIHIIPTGYKPKGRLQRFRYSQKYLYQKSIEIDADIYQISDPELISIGRKLKKKGKKVIFNLREYYPDLITKKTYIPVIARRIISKYYSYCLNRYINDYDVVFTVTPEIVELLQHVHGAKNAKLLTNYPIPNEKYILRKEDYLCRPNTLFYEGTVYEVSRQEKVFDALLEIPNVHYFIAGKIEDGYERIKEQPYWKFVEFKDGFKKNELIGFFSRATISNILRDWGKMDGSLGVLKLFESMEAAIPVLLPNCPIYQDLVRKYHCGICVDPNDALSIKLAIEYLIKNKEEAYQMGQNGRKAVLEEYNWPQQAVCYIGSIEKILEA